MSPKNSKQIKYIFANIAVITVTVLWLLPIIWMLLNSFRSSSEPFYSGILPSFYTLDNYIDSLFDKAFMKAFRNSLIVASSSAVLVVILAGLAAYGFSRYRFRGQNILQVLLLVIRLFPAILLAITLFQVAGFLNVYDTFVPLIIVNAVINFPFAIWNLKTTFDALPIELEEASWLDGLSRVGGIFRILLPLMAPSIVATMAFVFLLKLE